MGTTVVTTSRSRMRPVGILEYNDLKSDFDESLQASSSYETQCSETSSDFPTPWNPDLETEISIPWLVGIVFCVVPRRWTFCACGFAPVRDTASRPRPWECPNASANDFAE